MEELNEEVVETEQGADVDENAETTLDEQALAEGQAEEHPEDKMDWEKSFKEVQGSFTKETQANKELRESISRLDDYGGIDGLVEQIQYLQSADWFKEGLQAEQQKDAYGVDSADMDTESKQAIALVEKVANQIAEQKVAEIRKQLEPFEQQRVEDNMNSIATKMDEAHPGWKDLSEKMTEFAQELPDDRANNPSFEDFVSLYYRAAASDPKVWDSITSKSYQSKLEKAKKNSVSKPGATQAVKGGSAKTILEAFQQANG